MSAGSRVLAIFLVPFAVAILHSAAARKCQEKCNEYSKLVYEEELAPVLRIGAGSNTVSRCTIIETPLIVGGVEAKPAEFPHMAAIGYLVNGNDVSWQCGGTIISDIYVLTAAHCLQSSDGGVAARVRAGTTSLVEPEEGTQDRNVAARLKHPLYRPPVRYHDIALLRLDAPFALTARLRPACLDVGSRFPEKTAIASGFGKTAFDASSGSDRLMKVQLDYIPEDVCKESYAADIGGRQLPQGMIPQILCAGVMSGGKDTCQGDSGGPLQRILAEPYCAYSVVGVTSFGKFCAFKNSPAVYTRVSGYLDWIESIVWP